VETLDFLFRAADHPVRGVELLDLDQHALARHGLVVKATSGVSHATWYRMIRRRQVEPLHPGIARLPGTPRTFHQHIAAAVWACGGNALASHRSAMHLHGLELPKADRGLVDIIVPGRSRKPVLEGVRVHRPTDSLRLSPHVIDGIRCTNVLRTLVDLGAVAPQLVHDALGHALSGRLVDFAAIACVLHDHGRKGRAGVGALRTAFGDWAIDGKPADSILEAAFARLVERFDLPRFEFHPVIEGWEVDFRLVGTRVVIECDGWTTHGLDRRQFERDRRRDDDLTAAGWIVQRFTYRAITATPADTARRIRRLVAGSEHSRPV
jgi:very-short-patch-repair endonuclease